MGEGAGQVQELGLAYGSTWLLGTVSPRPQNDQDGHFEK